MIGANGQPRPYFTLTVAPGGSSTDAVAVSNGGPTMETLKIGVSDGVTAANSGSAYSAVPDRCAGPGCWVTELPATVVLQPHEQEALVFRVAVPPARHPVSTWPHHRRAGRAAEGARLSRAHSTVRGSSS